MMMRSALYQTNMLSQIFLQCQLTEIIIRRQTCLLTRTHYPDSEPTSLCSFSLMLRAQRRSNKYQFYSLWFDLIGSHQYVQKNFDTIYMVQLLKHEFTQRSILFLKIQVFFYIIISSLRWYHTLQGDNSLKSVECFDHMMFV